MRDDRGFTLMELLITMAIVIFLGSVLIVGLLPQKDKALRTKTMAILEAVKSALDQYRTEFGDYPPDGYDRETAWNNATPSAYAGVNVGIKLPTKQNGTRTYYGSGCLIYFLCYPITNTTTIGAAQGADPRNKRVSPCNKGAAFLSVLARENFSAYHWSGVAEERKFDVAIDPKTNASYGKDWEKCEIVDAYGFPIHYDKVGERKEDGNYPARGTVGQLFDPTRFQGREGLLSHSDDAYIRDVVVPRTQDSETETDACPTSTHRPGTGFTHADPRARADSSDGCILEPADVANRPGPRNQGNYDLWAHGRAWANGITAVTNWK